MDNEASENKKKQLIVNNKKGIRAPEFSFIFVLLGILIMRVPVMLNIGADGSGLFGIATDLFMLIYVSLAMSLTYTLKASVTSASLKAQYRSVIKKVEAGTILSVIYAVVIGGVLAVTAEFLSKYLICEQRSQLVIYAAIPAMVFSLLSSSAKGYLLGCRLGGVYSAGNFLEAVLCVVFSMAGSGIGWDIGDKASVLLVNEDIKFIYGAAGAMAGVSAAELLCFIYWMIMLMIFIRPMKSLAAEDNTTGGGSVAAIMRIMLGRIMPNLLIGLMISTYFLITMRIFFSSYKDESRALYIFGEYNAVYLSIICLGSIACFLAAAGRIRAIIRAQKKDEQNKMNRMLNSSFRFLLVSSMPIALFLTALGGNIASLLGVKDSSMILGYFYFYSVLAVSSAVWLFISVILIEQSYISEAIINTAISYIISLLFAYTLIALMQSMAGAIIGMIMFTVMNGLLSGIMIKKKMGMRIRITSYIVKLFLCGAIYFAVLFALKWLLATYVGDLAAVLVGLVVGWLLYVFLIAQFHVLTDKQICQLPCGEIMVMFLRGADTREE